ncbi:MAG TPA: hypothetical protein G4O10_08585 [Dehalococcoidia bacterium]|nr:hypothetical protein [Dehalococcoidia bacterium]
MSRLLKTEQETIINYNNAEDTAYIYTCSVSLMQHLEKKPGLQPTATHGRYAREYECPKSWIKKPRKPRQLSEVQKEKLRLRFVEKSILRRKLPSAVGDSGGEK